MDSPTRAPLAPNHALAVSALLFNALIWGLSWWPMRALQAAGLHPLWTTALMYTLALACLLLLRRLRPGARRSAPGSRWLWLLALCAGLTNITFNWAVTVGDVLRVVLLFYLMPAWAVLLAWKLLGERPSRLALARLLLAFVGVALVLLPAGASVARLAARPGLADLLALAGGLCFALTNISLRRLRDWPADALLLAMFAGDAGLAGLGVGLGLLSGVLTALPAPELPWVSLILALAGAFFLGGCALQFGAARLAAGTTALVMLSEVVFASVSSVLLSAARLDARTLLGGALILLAALLAALPRRRLGAAAA